MVMLAVVRLREDAYGVPISKAIEESTGREVLVGSIYAALERLEAKGFVRSKVGEATAARGGQAKRYFRITEKGIEQVRERRALRSLSCGNVSLRCKEEHDENLTAADLGNEVSGAIRSGSARRRSNWRSY